MASQMVCSKCDRKAGKGMKFCPRCGGELMPAVSGETPKVLTPEAVDELKSGTPEVSCGVEASTEALPETPIPTANKVKSTTAPKDEEYEFTHPVALEETAEDFFDRDPAKGMRLEAISGPCARITAMISDGGTATIGATPAANLFLEQDKCVSRHHAVVSFTDGRAFIKDAGSLNGTYIKVCSEIELKDGDILLIGKTLIKVTRE